MAEPVTQNDLELYFGAQRVADAFAVNGGQAHAETVARYIKAGLDDCRGLLMNGWPESAVDSLISNDDGIKRACCRYILGARYEDDPSHADSDGKHPLSGWTKQAKDLLLQRALGNSRSVAEDTAGANKAKQVKGLPAGRKLVWGGTSSSPNGQGGF